MPFDGIRKLLNRGKEAGQELLNVEQPDMEDPSALRHCLGLARRMEPDPIRRRRSLA